jgi:hypothetical protein
MLPSANVKNLTIHNVVYNGCWLQDTWVER